MISEQYISVPCYVIRGAGKSTHYEYEVRIELEEERWKLLRRYRRFRELFLNMKALYGLNVSIKLFYDMQLQVILTFNKLLTVFQVARIPFPPRHIWNSESLARTRRPQLELFLRSLIRACANDKRCPFFAQPLTKETLVQFSPFFRKGVFETGKCGTG